MWNLLNEHSNMKNQFKIAALCGVALVGGLTACNDAEYGPLGCHAYISESVSSSSHSTKVVITDEGVYADVTVCLSEAATQDVTFRFEVDEEVLNQYNAKQASSFVTLPEAGYEMEREVTVKAGTYGAVATKIYIKPLTEDLIGESYAIPLRLVSVDGAVPVTSTTATYVVTTEAVITSSYPMFNGSAGLYAEGFSANLPQFTVECRFQVSDTANRNRAVFTNGGSVLLRFEDPQAAQDGVPAHSLVQFQGQDWYMNPTDYFRTDQWQHLALTYNGTAVTLYVNGAFAGTKEGVCAPEFAAAAWFGGDAGGGHGTGDSSWWAGCKILCSELRIWSYARSASQIQNNMTTVSARSEGLVAYWRMNDGAGQEFEDYTGNGYTLKTNRTPTWVENIKSTDTATPWP